ncbi:hypothetical protein [Streptomyces sp. NPDC003077]|uniref:hypothetical protein n=1 Tax=Streptomyces sp. NPDC003077 TaxID=3154443 RepID=UPI0033BE6BD6
MKGAGKGQPIGTAPVSRPRRGPARTAHKPTGTALTALTTPTALSTPTALAALVALAVVLLAGCGVRPTGVLDGGEPPGGLTKNLRLYFVSPAGRLVAVSRPDIPASKVTDPDGVIKLLRQGPTPAERASGLTTSLTTEGAYETTVSGNTVTVRVPQAEIAVSSQGDRSLSGQLVCSIARARAMADGNGATRTDDIRVTLRAQSGRPGSYVCSDFLR